MPSKSPDLNLHGNMLYHFNKDMGTEALHVSFVKCPDKTIQECTSVIAVNRLSGISPRVVTCFSSARDGNAEIQFIYHLFVFFQIKLLFVFFSRGPYNNHADGRVLNQHRNRTRQRTNILGRYVYLSPEYMQLDLRATQEYAKENP